MQACRIAFAGFGNFYDPCRDELAQYVRARGSHKKIARFIECLPHDASRFIVEKDNFGGRGMHNSLSIMAGSRLSASHFGARW